jgi:hypothetical protein
MNSQSRALASSELAGSITNAGSEPAHTALIEAA